MKINISKMVEHAGIYTDEIQIEEDTEVNKNKIRQLVLHKINEQSAGQGKHFSRKRNPSARIASIIAVIVALMTSAVVVNAATGGKFFGAILLNDENRNIAKNSNYASMEEATIGASIPKRTSPIVTSNILNEDQLKSLPGNSVTPIVVKEKSGTYKIPEVLTNNGDIVIFTKDNEYGWQLNEGEKLTIHYALDLETNKNSDKAGERMEIGFVHNGALVKGQFNKSKEFSYTITAPEAGEYYFYIENYSAGYIIISSGSIE
ncbi:hypothetical protein [Cohnella abietis]|uniref:Uncharacterized protein n=1 Tax=Cohnella abietis TaxID=2507935 RepID=A0A3T1CYM2_9BACL|nr:hypothetical protein [Cohnella abietis]BBI30901.1 hypothetical protein KCTCHS21_03000 [Cohnella abietis]